MMYKIANHNCPNYLLDLFELKKCNYNMRNSINNLLLPKFETCYKKKSFSYFGAKCWNSISPELKRELSIMNFKHNLNKYMESRDLNEQSPSPLNIVIRIFSVCYICFVYIYVIIIMLNYVVYMLFLYCICLCICTALRKNSPRAEVGLCA